MAGANLNWAVVKEWKSSGLALVVDDLIEERRTAMTVHESIESVDVTSNWKGAGAALAQESLGKLKDTCARHMGLVDELLSATEAAQDGVSEVEKLVAEAESLAGANDLVIDDTGAVRTLNPVPATDFNAFAILKECSDKVAESCNKALEVDETYARVLGDSSAGKNANAKGFDDPMLGMPNVLKEELSTQEIAQWWHSLSEVQRGEIIKRATEEARRGVYGKFSALGNANGMSADARGKINHARVIYDSRHSEGKTKEDAQKIVDALKDHSGDGDPDKKTLLFYEPATGAKGNEITHAAIAVGDVDNADYVTTYVPGKGTTVEAIGGMTGNMTDLKARAEAEAGGGKVATIAWIGYDCPPGFLDAVSPERAEMGGETLAKHLEGIADSRAAEGKPVHQSVLGHSYGSTTTSYAMKDVRPGVVENYGVMGSPGLAGKAEDMHVPEGHSYAMGFRDPFKGTSGSIFNNYDPMNAVDDAFPKAYNFLFRGENPLDSSWAPLGIDPTDSSSGFKLLDPGQVKVPENQSSVNPHSAYLVKESQAQGELAKVILGKAG